MKLQQIRNATIKITYGEKVILVDPWFQKKGTGLTAPTFDKSKRIPSPTVELPMSIREIMDGIDAIFVSHIHPDHFEDETAKILDKYIPVYAPDAKTAAKIRSFGYTDVTVLTEQGTMVGDVKLIRTKAKHRSVFDFDTKTACGLLLQCDGEKQLYVAGDTVYYKGVEETLSRYMPEVIVLNACGAKLPLLGRLIMDSEEVVKVCRNAPNAVIVASHMEAVNHATVTRADLRNYADHSGVGKQVFIPADGETVTF